MEKLENIMYNDNGRNGNCMDTMNKNMGTNTNEEEETVLDSVEISPAQKSSQNYKKSIKLNHQTKVILKNHKSYLIQILNMK